MKKTARKSLKRLTLYLKNFDLLKVPPSVFIYMEPVVQLSKEHWDKLGAYLKSWFIQDLFISGQAPDISSLDKDDSININLKIKTPINELLLENKALKEKLFFYTLFSSKNYKKLFKTWNKDVHYFWNDEPEIIKHNQMNKSDKFQIKDTDSIAAIFLVGEKSGKIYSQNITDLLNLKNGILHVKKAKSETEKIIILRKSYLRFDDYLYYFPDFSDKDVRDKIFEKLTAFTQKKGAKKPAFFFDFNQVIPFDSKTNLPFINDTFWDQM